MCNYVGIIQTTLTHCFLFQVHWHGDRRNGPDQVGTESGGRRHAAGLSGERARERE